MDVTQELLTLTGELEGGFMFEDTSGETKESGKPVIFDRSVLLIQNLTAGLDKNTAVSFHILHMHL